MKRFVIIILVFFLTNSVYSQNISTNILGKWYPIKTLTEDSIETINDLPFFRMTFNKHNYVSLYPKFGSHYAEPYGQPYKIFGNLLTISNSTGKMSYEIYSISENNLILKNAKTYYHFDRLLDVIKTDSTIEYVLYADTIVIVNKNNVSIDENESVKLPLFKGDFLAFSEENFTLNTELDSSFNIPVILKISKKGLVDSVRIDVKIDENLKKKISESFLLSKKKWFPAKFIGKKIDYNIKILLLSKSSYISNINYKSYAELIEKVFNEGYKNDIAEDYERAINYYDECITLYEYFNSAYNVSYPRHNTKESLIIWKFRVNSIMNKAIVNYKLGNLEKACNGWKEISTYDKEALEYMQRFCGEYKK